MKKILLISLVVLAAFGEFIYMGKLSEENDRLRANNESLIRGEKEYQTRDSLHAMQVGILSQTIGEYEQTHAEDVALIKTLKTKKSSVSSVGKVESMTVAEVTAAVTDTVIIHRDRTDTLRCINFSDQWASVEGCSDGHTFSGRVTIRDTLIIVASIERKRFLGFLWRTRKIKRKSVDVVSRNPYTHIDDVEYVEINK